MESQPQNPEFRKYPENFHPCSIRLVRSTDQMAIIDFAEVLICLSKYAGF